MRAGSHIHSLITAIDVYNQNENIFNEYGKSILKGKFFNVHEPELSLFQIAKGKLDSKGITPSSATREMLSKTITNCTATQDKMKQSISQLKAKIDKVQLAKNIIERLQSNKAILLTKSEVKRERRIKTTYVKK